jgi:hypothetical protein
MTTIKMLERLLVPYETSSWGASDGFGNTYQVYRNGEKTSRIDSAAWFLVRKPRSVYKNELRRVISELGIESGKKGT